MEVFQCQLISVISHKKDINILIYSVLYLCIIIMLGIFIYWDAIYKSAKRSSKCNNISKIIEENYYTEFPYVYTIVIVNTKNIKKPADYIIKIKYDFNKMETNIEYGDTISKDGSGSGSSSGDSIFIHRIHEYALIYEDIKRLEEKKEELYATFKRDKNRRDLEEYNKVAVALAKIVSTKEGKRAIELNNNKGLVDSFNYTYYNLEKMGPDIIEDISTRINSNDYKYYAVDKNYNIIYSYTTNELIKFIKGYSTNKNYPETIIDYIIFSKIQRTKNINI